MPTVGRDRIRGSLDSGASTSSSSAVPTESSQPTAASAQAYDAIVIGGGPAGLSGAQALVRFRRSVLVIDSGVPRNAPAGHLHNFLSRDGTPPADLLALGRAEVESYGGHVITADVTAAARSGAGFDVELADGRRFSALRLLVTTIPADPQGATSVPGVWAAVEVARRDQLSSPTTAAGRLSQ